MRITVADYKTTRYQRKLVKKVLKSGRITYGPLSKELEDQFAHANGHKHALFVNSGTMALTLSLRAMKDRYGWADGSEVIMPAVTFVATMNAITYANLKPVLIDIKPDTLNMDSRKIKKALTKRTVAIMPVHLLGLPADMETILRIAKRESLKVIEDSCETMFTYCPHGDVTCYSTYLAHLMVTGVGGFICTDNDGLAAYMRSMMFHGRDGSYLSMDDHSRQNTHSRFLFDKQGFSARATEMEAALGLGEMRDFYKKIYRRQWNAAYLRRHLDSYAYIPQESHSHVYMLFPVIVENGLRDAMMDYLEERGIHTRTIMPLTNQPIVKQVLGDVEEEFPVAKSVNDNGLLIGCHQYLSKKDLDYTIMCVKGFYESIGHRK